MIKFIDLNKKPKIYVSNQLEGYYPPILDYNATIAAQSLTKEDTEIAYKVLNDCFFNLMNNKYSILYNSILYSMENFSWFATFFKEVERIYTNGEEDLKILYDLAPDESRGLRFQEPYYVSNNKNKDKDNKYPAVYYPFKLRTNDPVNKYRVLYIKKDLELEDFYDGFPGWYIMKNTTVFEKYNERTNVRVRIDFRNGEFIYYVSGASDAWQVVEDVPLEIDDVVSAILFR